MNSTAACRPHWHDLAPHVRGSGRLQAGGKGTVGTGPFSSAVGSGREYPERGTCGLGGRALRSGVRETQVELANVAQQPGCAEEQRGHDERALQEAALEVVMEAVGGATRPSVSTMARRPVKTRPACASAEGCPDPRQSPSFCGRGLSIPLAWGAPGAGPCVVDPALHAQDGRSVWRVSPRLRRRRASDRRKGHRCWMRVTVRTAGTAAGGSRPPREFRTGAGAQGRAMTLQQAAV